MQGTLTDLTGSPSGVIGTPMTPFLLIGGYTFSLTGTENSPGARTFRSRSRPDRAQRGRHDGRDRDARRDPDGEWPRITGMQAYNGVFTAQFAGLTPAQVFNTINRAAGCRRCRRNSTWPRARPCRSR